MNQMRELITILMADDDEEDRMMTKEAWENAKLANEPRFVHDGEELMDYLQHRGEYADVVASPSPGLILLDLNMPKMDGREAWREIKDSPELRRIPIVVLTTSKAEEDIIRSYDLGASSYITKPVTFEGLVAIVKELGKYWFELVELPSTPLRQVS